jgi:ABC-type transport system involved in multi-copper enzyme maturation permease subunit
MFGSLCRYCGLELNRPLTKLSTALLLITILGIAIAQVPESHATYYPYGDGIMIGATPVIISPTGTDIPLDATIQVEMWRGSFKEVGNLNLTPAVPVLNREEEYVIAASPLVTFHLSELLQPKTNYTVTLPIANETVTWNFTTGNFTLGNSVTNGQSELLFSFVIAGVIISVIVIISIAAVAFKKREKKYAEPRT